MMRGLGISLLVLLLVLGAAIEVEKKIDTSEIIRLHVLANSDTSEDQQLKIKVKNSIITYMKQQFATSSSIEESRHILLGQAEMMRQVALQTLQEEGSDYGVEIQYGMFQFPIKYYGSFSLPAGQYEAMRVVIGQGKGENWWCVLFPPMCFVDTEDEQGLETYSEVAPEEKVVFKWRIAQWIDGITDGI